MMRFLFAFSLMTGLLKLCQLMVAGELLSETALWVCIAMLWMLWSWAEVDG